MKMSISFLSLFFFTALLPAQPVIEWQKAFGGSYADQGQSIKQTTDKGFIVATRTASTNGDVIGNHGGGDFWMLKLDTIGTLQWKKTYGGTNNETPNETQQTTDGGYVVAGYTHSSDGDVTNHHGDRDAWVLKLDNTGTIQWQKALGSSGWEEASDIQQTLDGGYILVGRSNTADGDVTTNHGAFDYWVVKLNSSGDLEWQKSYGGTYDDIGYAIRQTMDGGYIVAGESASNDGDVQGNHGSLDYWVIKLNHEGEIEWQKSLGGSSYDRANDIQQTRDGGYVVFGQVYSSNGDVTGHHGYNDFWLVKLDALGKIEWQNALGGSNEDYGRSVQQTNDGGFIMTGQTQSNNGDVSGNDGGADIWVLKLTETGEIQWQKTLGGTLGEWGNSIQQTSDNGYIVAGYAASNNGDVSGNHGGDDLWVVKLSAELVSVKDVIAQPSLDIFPNPAQKSISIHVAALSKEEEYTTVRISDCLGRVMSLQTMSWGGSVDIGALPKGLYLVTATMPSGRIYAGKLMKE